MTVASSEMQEYFDSMKKILLNEYALANKARLMGIDPDTKVEVQLAETMAERVVGLISVLAPQIVGSGVDKRIQELEAEYSALDWRVALQIALEVAQEKFCKFKDKREAIEVGIRVGFAYGTVGVVSSPIEGLVNVEIKKRFDGKGEYFCLNYSGPIRNAGGTAASWSVIIADYVRKNMGYAEYDPTDDEAKRCFTEISDYHERVTNLQYFPSKEESLFIVKNVPVEISGDPSEKIEVSNQKDLSRIPTNFIRSGYCLIHSSCIPLKAPKLWKQLNAWGKDFGMEHWGFLEEFLKIQKEAKSKGAKAKSSGDKKEKIKPDFTYIKDLVAGRPILGHPLRNGAFRLRYGRARTSGYSAQSIHPATMHVLRDYIAIGTQLKVERPGKGATYTPCDVIEGPIVKLNDGSVVRLNSESEAKKVKKDFVEILYLGDVLINYGDFFDRAHPLVPAGYCEEWWIQELEKSAVNMLGSLDYEKMHEYTGIPAEFFQKIIKNPFIRNINSETSIKLSQTFEIPLHPRFTYHWNSITKKEFIELMNWLVKIKIEKEGEKTLKGILFIEAAPKRLLEIVGIPHIVSANEYAVLDKDHTQILWYFIKNYMENKIQMSQWIELEENAERGVNGLINNFSKIFLRDKNGTFIGSRMGRPEKAKMRKLIGSPHVLFPIGEEGGRLKCFQSALDAGKVTADFPTYECTGCGHKTVLTMCEKCWALTVRKYTCSICGEIDESECPKHGKTQAYKKQEIPIKDIFQSMLKKLGTRTYPDLIKGVRETRNRDRTPEHIIKGILRAIHKIHVNKEGTIRYDASELPLTHFKPKEIFVSVDKLVSLGYTKDIYGKELTNENQILEIKPQDVVLPCCPDSPDEACDTILFRTTKFIDDLLVRVYGQEPYYNLRSKEELVGHLIIGLAPHTSAGILGRIIGFSKTQGFLAHPYMHAAMRRDTDGDESCLFLCLDAFLNFSKRYLPSSRGSTMDAPLVLTTVLIPSEVDDMVFNMDIVGKYPLELYEAALEYKKPWDIKIKKINEVLDTEEQYEKMMFTHDTDNFNCGVLCSAYKTIPSMQDKLLGQMKIAESIRAVDESDVARLIIDKHFIRDIKGNLRKFSMQEFRCVKCNTKYRRPPMIGLCTNCGGKIIFTISEGSIVKYLEPSISLSNKYNLPIFMKQTLELVKRRIEGVFGKEKEKQVGLGAWFG
ncbi:DNA polymerase II large subunit [Candidatus Woesearchaeota archaeon]|jgi:DNA polymerase II large subunit|nr:DNA polymerase II large subunit [Candidatus Woesearchaeota archaeon]